MPVPRLPVQAPDSGPAPLPPFSVKQGAPGAPARCTSSPLPDAAPPNPGGSWERLFSPSSPVPITNTGDPLGAAGEVLEVQHLGRDCSSVWPARKVGLGSPTRAAHSALPRSPMEPIFPYPYCRVGLYCSLTLQKRGTTRSSM